MRGSNGYRVRFAIWLAVAVSFGWLAPAQPSAGPLEDGVAAYENRDYKTAVLFWEEAAKAGDAAAMNNLGFIYSTVYGDYKTALKHWRDAADAGNADAMHNLGLVYDFGNGAPRSDKLALFWYLKAARKGFTKSLYSLGIKYDNGEGVARNEVTAYMFLLLAASDGTRAFARTRDQIGKHMTKEQKQTARQLAAEWVRAHKKK